MPKTWTDEVLETPPDKLTPEMIGTIRFNSHVRHNYEIRWNWPLKTAREILDEIEGILIPAFLLGENP